MSSTKHHEYDCVVIGGGVVGLSIANELARHSQKVALVTKSQQGKQASWAGAGIIPPPIRSAEAHPAEKLQAFSTDLHRSWNKRLKAETGIDTEFRKCGGLSLARNRNEWAMLNADLSMLHFQEIDARMVSAKELCELEPNLKGAVDAKRIFGGVFQPDEHQIRNPRFLKAISESNQRLGVEVVTCSQDQNVHFQVDAQSYGIQAISFGDHQIRGKAFCVAAGAWTHNVLSEVGIGLPVFPMRGQMLLFEFKKPPFQRILNAGSRYVVSRSDGKVLAGSTEEETGFVNQTTNEMRDDLLEFCKSVDATLNMDALIDHWSGLRPATLDRFPFLGQASVNLKPVRCNRALPQRNHKCSGDSSSHSTAYS